ncbi:DUF2345 domain-containing protein, partial [Cronobacter malonaticus]
DAANALQADIASQSAMFSERLKPLNQMIHVSAPDGMAFTSGEHMQLTATKNVAVNAGGDISVGVMGNMTALAGEKLGLFARSGPLSLKSGEGPVEVQAQNGGMQLAAEKKLTLTSVSDISFAGKKRITLIGGGSYLTLEAGKIEYGTPQVYLRKVERTFNASKAAAAMALPDSQRYSTIDDTNLNKRVVSVGWSYGDKLTKIENISRYFVDLNLHVVTEGYLTGDTVKCEVVYMDDNNKNISLILSGPVNETGEAILRDVLSSENPCIYDHLDL